MCLWRIPWDKDLALTRKINLNNFNRVLFRKTFAQSMTPPQADGVLKSVIKMA